MLIAEEQRSSILWVEMMFLTDEQDLWQCIYSYSIARKSVHPCFHRFSITSGIYCRANGTKLSFGNITRLAGNLAPPSEGLQRRVKFTTQSDEWATTSCFNVIALQ